MKPTGHDATLIRERKRQPIALMLTYILIGGAGMGFAFLLELSPTMNIIVVALSGFLIGTAAEKLVSQRMRKTTVPLFADQKPPVDQ